MSLVDKGVDVLDEDEQEEAARIAYARAVGARLRTMRKQMRLSLQAVEAMSEQEFKASVLGAYERGSGPSRFPACSGWPSCTTSRWISCCHLTTPP